MHFFLYALSHHSKLHHHRYCMLKVIATGIRENERIKVKKKYLVFYYIDRFWKQCSDNRKKFIWKLDFFFRSLVWYGRLRVGVCHFRDSIFFCIDWRIKKFIHLLVIFAFYPQMNQMECFHRHNYQYSSLSYEWSKHAVFILRNLTRRHIFVFLFFVFSAAQAFRQSIDEGKCEIMLIKKKHM